MKRKMQYLVIHCTDTPEGRKVTSDEIRHWHTDPKPKGRGWHQVGYRCMYHLDGTREELVPNNGDEYIDPWEITNGVAGENSIAQHWVYVGGADANMKPKDTRTFEQEKAMASDVLEFHRRFPEVLIVGHHHFNQGKACPSFDVQSWLKFIGINQQL